MKNISILNKVIDYIKELGIDNYEIIECTDKDETVLIAVDFKFQYNLTMYKSQNISGSDFILICNFKQKDRIKMMVENTDEYIKKYCNV